MSVYEGNENYIFISYAHKDSKVVLKVVDELMTRGFRVWYDEGITPGSEWPENIAQHLDGSAAVIAFVTPNAMASDNCRREIHFALSRQKPFLAVHLEKTELPLGMELQMAAQQSVLRYNFRTERAFIEQICSCEHLHPCLMPNLSPTHSAPQHKSAIRPRRKTRWLAYVCAVLAAAAALGYAFGGEQLIAEITKLVSELSAANVSEEPVELETEAAAEPSKSKAMAFMRKADTSFNGRFYTSASYFWGQQSYTRGQVQKVQFQSTQEGVPDSAWDVSEAEDRSILAWLGGSTLHVAANGRIGTTDASFLFEYFVNLESVDWGDCFDASAVTSMQHMFYGCNALTEVDFTGFNTSAVTDMRGMFWECSALTGLDLSSFDTSAVTDMGWMFSGCSALIGVDVSRFNTSAVTDMRGMFSDCTALTSVDVSRFDTSAAADMSWMFSGCGELAELDVSHFDISAVTNMDGMFYGSTKLPASSIPSWYTGNV